LPTALIALLVVGCTPVPKVELTAYTTAYSDSLEATNGVLDIVEPYERVVMRVAAGDMASIVSSPRVVGPPLPAKRKAVTPAKSLPPPDPTLFANPSAVSSAHRPPPDPTLFANPSAVSSAHRPPPDPDLLADQSAVSSARPMPPPDQTLFANPSAVKRAKPAAPLDPTPAGPIGASTLVGGAGCRGIGGTDPFCYELRDAWADIGDPPLVAAYRNLSNVVLRFNNLLVAYANGVDGRLLEQDVNSLSAAASELTQVAPIAALSGVGGFASGFSGAVSALAPIAGLAGQIADRAQLRSFLLNNYENVDNALALMATGSVELYANVAIGTNLFRRMVPPGEGQSLVTRRQEIRRLIANWTVLLDDNRRLLRELRAAVAAPDGLETRLKNLDPTIKASTDTSMIKRQIATLGAPTLSP
jgi:hypothetical protein